MLNLVAEKDRSELKLVAAISGGGVFILLCLDTSTETHELSQSSGSFVSRDSSVDESSYRELHGRTAVQPKLTGDLAENAKRAELHRQSIAKMTILKTI
ncbi:hypothetical protein ACS0TY_026529 [Phlomoides rotata]